MLIKSGRQPSRFIASLALFILLVACSPQDAGGGTLAGKVTIGPLVPVMREGELEPTPSPEMYAAREVVIFDASGNRELQRVQIGPSGEYSVDLPAGRYTIDINRIGIDTAAGLPTQIEIIPFKVSRLDIDIDTGIR